MSTIFIIILSECPVFCIGLQKIFEETINAHTLGIFEDWLEVLNQINDPRPDILMCEFSIFEVLTPKLPLQPNLIARLPPIIVISRVCDIYHAQVVLNAGVDGFIMDTEAPATFIQAVKSVLMGNTWFSSAIFASRYKWGKDILFNKFTARELEVLQLLAQGNSNKQVALALRVKERTGSFHVSNILSKMNVSSRLEAVLWARTNKLIA